MPRTYGTTNFMPYAAAPAVGPVGDCYYNTASKTVFVSDGTNWNALQGATGGAGGGAPYAPVTGTSPPPSAPVISPPTGLLWVDTSTSPTWAPSTGPPGQGVPPGGTTGQFLAKNSNTDYDTKWIGAQNLIFWQTCPPIAANTPYTVTHNLNTQYIQVQLWDATLGLLIGAQVQILNANSIQLTVSQGTPNNVNVVVVGLSASGPPINPPDYATKAYVDAKTTTLPAPVTSGSGVQSFTDVFGTVWVAANGVRGGNWYRARDVLATHVYAALNSALTANVFTKIPYNTVRAAGADPYSLWSLTNYSFTAPVAGRYFISARSEVQITSAVYRAITSIFQNNAEAYRGPDIYGNTAPTSNSMVAADVIVAVGDVIDIRHYPTPAGTAVYANAVQTWCNVVYLGTG